MNGYKTRIEAWAEDRMAALASYINTRLIAYLEEKGFDQYEIERLHLRIDTCRGFSYRFLCRLGDVKLNTGKKVSPQDVGPDVAEAWRLLQDLEEFSTRYLENGVNGKAFAEKAIFPDDGKIFDGILADITGTESHISVSGGKQP